MVQGTWEARFQKVEAGGGSVAQETAAAEPEGRSLERAARSPAGSRPSASAVTGTGVQREGEAFPGTHGSDEASLVPRLRGPPPQVSSEALGSGLPSPR